MGDQPLHTRQMVSVSRVLGDDIINGCSMSQCKLHCIQPLLRIDHECRVKICCPLLIMVMLPYEWKILKWNENYSKQTNKLIRGSILLKKVSTVRGRWCLDWQLLTPIPLNKQQKPTWCICLIWKGFTSYTCAVFQVKRRGIFETKYCKVFNLQQQRNLNW